MARLLLIKGGKYYEEAKEYYPPSGLTTKEFLRLLYNLHKNLKYKEALSLLKDRISSEPNDRRLQIAHADTLFRLRKYSKAARLYEKMHRLKHAAIAYFRADDEKGLERIITKTRHLKGKTPCTALLLRGKQLRMKGQYDRALYYLRRAYRNYQGCQEEALWEIAWTEYLNGQYINAAYNLRDLYNSYRRPIYLYWLKKINKELGYKELMTNEKLHRPSLYLSLIRYENSKKDFLFKPEEVLSDIKLPAMDYPPDIPEGIKNRINGLYSTGLMDYIKREIIYHLKKQNHRRPYLYLLYKYGFYKEAIRLTGGHLDGNPYKERILYPIAFFDKIYSISTGLNLDPFLLLSVMRVESRFDPQALSRSGAMGLMQLMSFTAKRLAKLSGIDISLEEDAENSVFVPEINITLGATYLRWLLDKFQNPFLAVAAYNAGENAVDRWLKNLRYNGLDEFLEQIPYVETRLYVKKVFRTYEKYRAIYLQGQKATSSTALAH